MEIKDDALGLMGRCQLKGRGGGFVGHGAVLSDGNGDIDYAYQILEN